MKLQDVTFPLDRAESSALYSRLAFMGGRVFAVGSPRLWASFSDEKLLAVAAEQSRFDFRLLYILVALLAEHFRSFHPFRLHESIAGLKVPAVWGVILEFAAKLTADPDLKPFSAIALRGVGPAPEQMFYNPLRAPSPPAMLAAVDRTPDEFRKWGFFCAESPILKEFRSAPHTGTFNPEARQRILRRLFAERGEIGLSDYLSAIGHSISRQQAHLDLTRFPRVRTISDRRGRRYALARRQG